MEKKDEAEELMNALHKIEPLEDVPTDVSSRFKETLANLAASTAHTQPKKNWLTGSNQFALAASFTLVFALGAVFTLNSGIDQGDPIGISQNQGTNAPVESDIKEDQLLYSAGEGSIPEKSNTPIKLSDSAHDYLSIPAGFQTTLGVGITWNSPSTLEPVMFKCLKSIELDESTNTIDAGFLKKMAVTAIWAPISSSSWNVYLVDDACSVIEKRYVENK
jgi:hypothetical protein